MDSNATAPRAIDNSKRHHMLRDSTRTAPDSTWTAPGTNWDSTRFCQELENVWVCFGCGSKKNEVKAFSVLATPLPSGVASDVAVGNSVVSDNFKCIRPFSHFFSEAAQTHSHNIPPRQIPNDITPWLDRSAMSVIRLAPMKESVPIATHRPRKPTTSIGSSALQKLTFLCFYSVRAGHMWPAS